MQRDYEPLPTWQSASSGQNFLKPSDATETAVALSPYRQMRGCLRHQSHSLNHEMYPSPKNSYEDSYQSGNSCTQNNRSPSTCTPGQIPLAVTVCESDNQPIEMTPTLSVLDDFDYFCSMSGATSNRYLSECATPVMNSASNDTKARRQWLKKLRSQSAIPMTKAAEATSSPNSHGETRNVQIEGRRTPRYNYQRAQTQDCSLHPNDMFVDKRPPIRRQRSAEKEAVASRNSSSTSLTKNTMTSSSPKQQPLAPHILPPLPLCTESPLGAAISQEALAADDPDLIEFKVQVVGSPGVGKTTICQRLTNLNKDDSDFDAGDDADDDVQNFSIRAMLGGNEFNVSFSETNLYDELDSMNIEIQDYVDAFLVVYAIDDETTYEFARRVLLELGKSMAENSIPPAGFVLAANKLDLVRRREVNSEDARQFATAHNAKFLEISAALGHMIPELLLTVITHLCELDESKLGSRGVVNQPQHHATSTSSPSSPYTGVAGRRDLVGSTGVASKNSSGATTIASSSSAGGVYVPKTTSSKGSLAKFFRRHFSRSSTGFDGMD
uniref:GTP-binding protein GEM n=2 Tax=Schistocephalus solidus TaxID=70667 RepID=A0A0X3PWK7_SCHSO